MAMKRRSHDRSALRLCTMPSAALIVAVALAPACSAPGDIDNTSALVVLIAGNLSEVNTPFGDVLTSGGTIPDDSVTVRFTARLKQSTDNTAPSLQEVIVERYEVTFARTDGGTAVPAGFQRAMNAKVRLTPHNAANELFTDVTVSVMPSTGKAQPPISHLISPGFEPDTGFINIQCTATMRFFGRTVAGEEVSATASVGINFANFGDSNS